MIAAMAPFCHCISNQYCALRVMQYWLDMQAAAGDLMCAQAIDGQVQGQSRRLLYLKVHSESIKCCVLQGTVTSGSSFADQERGWSHL